MEQIDINKQILDKLNNLEIEIRIIRKSLSEDIELTDWAKEELVESRAIPDSESVSHEEVKKMILAK